MALLACGSRKGLLAVAILVVAVLIRRASAEPVSSAFLDADIGFGIASVDATQGLCGSYAAPAGALPMVRGGLGGGLSVTDDLAVVARAHATYATATGASPFALFLGAGVHYRIAQLAAPREYVFIELLPGYEASATSEAGNNASLAVATRVGVNGSWWTLAIGATLQIDPTPRAYTQRDIAVLVGVRFGR